jgi:hypothetical protein
MVFTQMMALFMAAPAATDSSNVVRYYFGSR